MGCFHKPKCWVERLVKDLPIPPETSLYYQDYPPRKYLYGLELAGHVCDDSTIDVPALRRVFCKRAETKSPGALSVPIFTNTRDDSPDA